MDAVGAVAEEVEGELDVHGVLVGGFEQFEHPAQVARDGGFAQQAVEGDQGVIAGGAGEVEVEGEVGAGFDDFFKGQGDEFVVLQVEAIHAALGVLAHVVEVGFGAAGGGVERDQAGVVVVAAVHGAGAEAEDQAQDAGLGEDVRVPGVGVEGEADAGGLGVVVAAVGGAADAHDEQGHAFLAVEQAAPLAVEEGLLVEDAGIDAADGVQQALAALLARAAVGDEDAFVFAGEGVAAGVFEDGAGADDVGGFAEVVQQALELFEDGGGEVAGLDAAAALGQALEEGGGVFLLFAQPPDIVLHQEGDEHLGAHEERVVRLQAAGQLGVVRADDGAGDEHAEGFAADGADADHAVAEGQEVVEGEVAFDQAGDAGAMHAQGAAELAQQVVRAPGRGAAGAGVGGGGLGLAEQDPPVAGAAVALEARPLGAGEDGGEDGAFPDREEAVGAADVERVHHVAGAVLDFDGADVEAAFEAEHVELVAGGAVDGLERVGGMAVAVEGEVGHRPERGQARANQVEEVAEALVRQPVFGQVRQAVEDIARAGGGGFDHGVGFAHQGFEAAGGRQGVEFEAGAGGEQRRVAGEAEIDSAAGGGGGGGGVGGHEFLVIGDGVHLPDEAVARLDAAEHGVQTRQAGGGGEGMRHGERPPSGPGGGFRPGRGRAWRRRRGRSRRCWRP
ncbi:MAG: hypothetical protein BWX68_02881 [Verrucomicrobia bacterium ADurb.Bin063]|nr:MAG: hypothetical protein BWX68_02881 [Verrucomicrobia bacterium ADurb.Bin063]